MSPCYKRLFLLIFAFLSLNYSFQRLAYGEEERFFDEAYILLTLGRYLGNSFYMVYVDEEETPYVDVEELLSVYLDFADVYCDVQRIYCTGVLHPGAIVFWLDGRNALIGGSESDTLSFDKNDIIVRDNKIWLRYDVFRDWLPTEVEWNLIAYRLHFDPSFKFRFERRQELEKLREQSLEQRRRAEYFDSLDPIMPTTNFNTSIRYSAFLSKNPGSAFRSGFNYTLNSDVYGGTLRVGSSGTFPFDGRRSFSRPYVTYYFKDWDEFHLMEFGSTNFSESALILPSFRSSYGFRYESKDRGYGEGVIVIRERAPPGTEVDLYVDGFYLSTVIADDDGEYVFPDVLVTGASSVRLSFFYPDGATGQRRLLVASDRGLGLKEGEFEHRIYAGNVDISGMNAGFYYGSLRYAFLDELSMGFSPIMFPNAERPSVQTMFNIAPFYWINFTGQTLFNNWDGSGMDRAFRGNFTLFYPHVLQVEHIYLNEGSPAMFTGRARRGEYWSVRHRVSMARWNLISNFDLDGLTKNFKTDARYRLTRSVIMSLGYWGSWYSGNSRMGISTGFNLNLFRSIRTEIYRYWLQQGASYNTIAMTLRGGRDVGSFDVSLRMYIRDRGRNMVTTNITYRIMERIRVGMYSSNTSVGFQIYWDDVIAGKYGPAMWDDFDTGIATGRIMSPERGDIPPEPIEGAVINIDTRTATTDADGYYKISGIRSESKVRASIDPNSIVSTMATEAEFEAMYFRKGSHIEWSPTLLPTIGMDGFVIMDPSRPFPKDLVIEAVRTIDSKVVSESEVFPPEGFFVLEHLTPGEFILSLNTTDMEYKPSINVTIGQDIDWISGVRWNMVGHKVEGISPRPVRTRREEFYVRTDFRLQLDLRRQFDSYYNVAQIRLHSANMAEDDEAERRASYYRRLVVVMDNLDRLWDVIAESDMRKRVVDIGVVLAFPKMRRDQIDVAVLRMLSMELDGRIDHLRYDISEGVEDIIKTYERIKETITELEYYWEELEMGEKAVKLNRAVELIDRLDKLYFRK